MESVVVLIAGGPNSVEIPCRIFRDMEQATLICDTMFPVEMVIDRDGNPRYNYDCESDEGEEISAELFTSHYYGCGGPYPFTLKEIRFDQAFVGFDLD